MTTARRGLVAALALLAGCGLAERPSVDTAFPADGEGTVLLGDSIMFSATEPILAELPRSTVDAVPGRTMVSPALSDAGLPRVEVLAESRPDRWVVELGTNDAFTVGSVTDDVVLADLDVLLGTIDATASDGEACVWWVLPHVAAPVDPASIARADLIATTLRDRLAARDCGGPIDWPGAVGLDPSLLDADGVHLTTRGRDMFAELIAGTIAEGD